MNLSNVTFEYLYKPDFAEFSERIFNILADNMGAIAPTGNTREEDYNCWLGCVTDGLKHDERQIVLIRAGDDIIGYFQYCANAENFIMEEIQFIPEYHGKGVFRKLYGFLIERMGEDIKCVEAYASIKNAKSIGILERFGLKNIGLNKNGRSYHFKGAYCDLLNWHKNA